MKVRATQNGYYGERRRKVGETFDLTDEKHFSKRWMVEVTAPSPLDHDGDGMAGGSARQEPLEELTGLRKQWKDLTGKNWFAGWNIETLKKKLAELATPT